MSLTKTFIKSKEKYKISFKLPKSSSIDASEVRLLGEFNDWDKSKAPKLKKLKDSFKIELELEGGKSYEYRYLVNNVQWVNDSNADKYVFKPEFGIENCVVDLNNVQIEEKVKATPAKAVKKRATKKVTKVAKAAKIDFTKIEGIGPKIAELLKTAGYQSFSDLANAETTAVKAILAAAGNRFKMHDPTTWPLQADLLAQGKTKELKKLQEELKGGKKAKA